MQPMKAFFHASLFTVALVSMIGLSARCWAVTYSITDLGTLAGGTFSVGQSINKTGDVTGTSSTAGDGPFFGPNRVFLFSGNVLHDLNPSKDGTAGMGINDQGQIVGSMSVGGINVHAFLYNGGPFQDLGTLGGGTSEANAINNSGQIAGTSEISPPGPVHPFLYSAGSMQDLGTLGGPDARGFGINDAGQVVGEADLPESIGGNPIKHAFLYNDHAMQDLGTLGGTNSTALAINAENQIVGASDPLGGNGSQHAFSYSGGVMHDLGTLGGDSSVANGINALGQIVGDSLISLGGSHAFLYQQGAMTDLNSLIDASNWMLSDARAINDRGQITGTGVFNQTEFHAFLLTPVPEPSSGALLLIAVTITIIALVLHRLWGIASRSCATMQHAPRKGRSRIQRCASSQPSQYSTWRSRLEAVLRSVERSCEQLVHV